MKLLTTDEFREGAKRGQRPDGTVFRFSATEPQVVGDEADRTQRFVFSDATVDHAGDSIDPAGWKLDVFRSNPVALFAHMSWDPPIGRASNVHVAGGQLVGDIEFATAEVYDFADTIYRLVKGKFLKAVSVGFIPEEWAFTSDKDRPYGIDFKKQLLLEISVCPVPCNPNALGEARSIGVDTRPLVKWAERVLDSGETVFLPRKDLETLRRQAGGVERRYWISSDKAVTGTMAETVRDNFARWQADPSAVLVLPKGMELHAVTTKSEDWKCGAASDLPLDESDSWDGAAAEASIFEHAGGDDFDPDKARKGFLVYDAASPKLRGSYKLPFAHVDGGELKAVKGGIRAAASRLPQTDIPDSAKSSAQGVIDHYEKAFGMKAMGEDDNGDGGALVAAPLGNCGRDQGAECGMKDPQECALHFTPPTKAVKAGRRVSAATRAKLEEAIGYHDAATKCIKSVMDGDDDDDAHGDDNDNDDGGGTPDPEQVGPDEPYDLTPEERRIREARALRESIPAD